MFPLIHRHLCGQLLAATAVAVVVFGAVLVTGNALREVFDLLAAGRIGWATCGSLLLILVPTVLPFALPLALLFAILLVYGRMSAQREMTALRAAGIGCWQMAAPAYLAGMVGSLLAFLVLTVYAPRAITQFREALAEVVKEEPLRLVEAKRFITEFPGFILHASAQQGDQLEGLRVWELDAQGRVRNYLSAISGTLTYDDSAGAIRLHLQQGTAELRVGEDPEALQTAFPVAAFQAIDLTLPIDALIEPPRRKIDYLTLGQLLDRLDQPDIDFDTHMALRMQIQKRFTFAFGVLSFAMLAVPLGLTSARVESHANLALALGLALLYFLAFTGISALESHPRLRPDLLLWLPNLACQGLGLGLMRRVR